MSEKRQDQAMRIYEAMNGVDPELLARSEKEKKVVPIYRYARWMAACLALILVGGTCYLTIKYGGFKKADTNYAADTVKENAERRKEAEKVEAAGENSHYQEEVAREEVDSDNDFNYVAPDVTEEKAWKENSEANACMEDSERAEEAKTETSDSAAMLFANKRFLIQPEVKQYFSDKWIMIDFENGESVQITDHATALKVYAYLKQLETRPADVREFASYVTVTVYDREDNQTDSFCISGEYLKMAGLPDVYEIIDQEYDYELLKRELDEVAQEEE